MAKKIGGWWRLWIALSAIYGLMLLFVLVLDWPKDWINRKLTSEELQSLTEESRGLVGSGEKVEGIEVVNTEPRAPLKEDDEYTYLPPKEVPSGKQGHEPRRDYAVPSPARNRWDAYEKEYQAKLATARKAESSAKARDDPYMAIAVGRAQQLQNGEFLVFKKVPTPAQVDLVKNDYARLQKASLWKERRSDLLKALLAWVLPCAFFLGLGLIIRWVFRGFRNKPPGQLPAPMDDTQPQA